jgi:hypothetical protein
VGEPEVLALDQEMTIAREAFLRALPAAVGYAPFAVDGSEIRPVDPAEGWRIVATPLSDLRLGMIALPRHRVAIHLTGYDDARRRAFVERFELHYRRAGG